MHSHFCACNEGFLIKASLLCLEVNHDGKVKKFSLMLGVQ